MDTEKTSFATAAVVTIAGVLFLAEFLPAFGDTYGYILDELYYIACAKRLDFGYIDHPPFAPFILRVVLEVLGDSLPAIRLLPALSGALTVVITGWMAYRLGGGRLAQMIAVLCVVVAPIPVLLFGFFSMNCFELLLWATGCWILIEMNRSGDKRLWILLGILLGVALENKHTSLLLVAGIAVATLLTPLRRHLLCKWLWFGALATMLLVVPNVIWQMLNDWPSLEFYRNLAHESNIPIGPMEILAEQIGATNPMTFPVWAAGIYYFFSARGARYRGLGWLFVTMFVIFMLSGASRPDRIQGVYPVMFAAGGIMIETASRREGWRWLSLAIPGLLLVSAILSAPLLLPFPPDIMARHPLAAGMNDSRREVGPAAIPLLFSHRLGSEEFVEEVAAVVHGLSPEERDSAIILTGDFAHAGALELFGPEHSLPRVFSPHNNYYLWGPEPGFSPPTVIAIALDENMLQREFRELKKAAIYRCEYCMGWRDHLPIYIAKSPRRPLLELWPEMRRIGLPTRKLLMLRAQDSVLNP